MLHAWMPNVTALCGQLVLILDTATSQGLLVPELWAGPIPTLSACLVQICHFPFLFPEMRQFLLNSQHVESSLYILFKQSWLPVWERHPSTPPRPCVSCSLGNPTFLQIRWPHRQQTIWSGVLSAGATSHVPLCRGREQEMCDVRSSDPDTKGSAHVPLLSLGLHCCGPSLGRKSKWERIFEDSWEPKI